MNWSETVANAEGLVTVYESSDGGTGDPARTFWQFFVGPQPVKTENHYLADTVQLAIRTNSRVKVTYDPAAGNMASQVRLEFEYACETRRLSPCKPERT
jgi:hypothetical protein